MTDRRASFTRRFLHSFWQLLAGGLCMAGGLALLYLGWYGAAHTRDVTDQIPYMISGGLLGSALIVVGGSFYFSFYVSRLHATSRRQALALERAIDRLERLSPGVSPASNGSVVAVTGGTKYHRPGCQLVSGKDATAFTPGQARERGLEPCKVCEPVSV